MRTILYVYHCFSVPPLNLELSWNNGSRKASKGLLSNNSLEFPVLLSLKWHQFLDRGHQQVEIFGSLNGDMTEAKGIYWGMLESHGVLVSVQGAHSWSQGYPWVKRKATWEAACVYCTQSIWGESKKIRFLWPVKMHRQVLLWEAASTKNIAQEVMGRRWCSFKWASQKGEGIPLNVRSLCKLVSLVFSQDKWLLLYQHKEKPQDKQLF